MGAIKHLLDEVANDLGIKDPNDAKVRAEAERRLVVNFCPTHFSGLDKRGSDYYLVNYFSKHSQAGHQSWIMAESKKEAKEKVEKDYGKVFKVKEITWGLTRHYSQIW